MHILEKTDRPPARPSWRSLTVRWILTFAGFPAGGFTARSEEHTSELQSP